MLFDSEHHTRIAKHRQFHWTAALDVEHLNAPDHSQCHHQGHRSPRIGEVFPVGQGQRAALGFRDHLFCNRVGYVGDALVVVVCVAAFPKLGSVDLLQGAGMGMDGLFFAAALSFFAYLGFEDIVKLAGGTRDPQRNNPRALFAANGIVLVIYTTLAVLVVSALPWQQLAGEAAPLAAIVESRWGRTGALFIAVAALFSTSNTLLSNMLGSSRVMAYMGRDVRPMRWMSTLTERKTPVRALLLILLVACGFAAIGDIEVVARIATITIFLTFLVVNLSVIALRVKQPALERPYRIPWSIGGVPVISVLGVLCTLVLLGYAVASIWSGGATG